jgi:hypothetical protein
MAARNGYKIVQPDGRSFYGNVQWPLGHENRLPRDLRPVLCEVGYHFCPDAGQCLRYVEWTKGRRLLRVRVPVDAAVVASIDGTKCCAAVLVAVADVTDRAPDLLRCAVPRSDGEVEYMGIGHDGEACGVIRTASFRRKWRRSPSGLYSMHLFQWGPHAPVIKDVVVVIPRGWDGWQAAVDELNRVEPFEPQ